MRGVPVSSPLRRDVAALYAMFCQPSPSSKGHSLRSRIALSAADLVGVPFPPPFLFVLGFGAGLVLNRFMPAALFSESPVAVVVLAWALVLSGAIVLGWALWTFFSARTAVVPNRPATDLRTSGPYQFSRNPMYMALTAMYIGLAL